MSANPDLQQWLALLEARHPVEIDMGLNRIAEVHQRLGAVRPAPRIVSVAGTNGKGSCVAMLDAVLRAAGLRCATYTSPHLLVFNERVTINGCQVSDQPLCEAFQRVEQARQGTSLSYFEFTTLAAFVLMADASVDIAILEVGLGGRLDAVNILDPDIAIITSIDLDHQHYLGNTREAVAAEKLGIVRAGRPLLCGETDLPANFTSVVAESGCEAQYFGRDFHYPSPLPPASLPIPSVACALRAAQLLDVELSWEDLSRLVQQTGLTGRFQRITYQQCELILDVAHNPAAAQLLAYRLSESAPCPAVVAMMADKDIAGVIEPLVDHVSHWFAAPLPDIQRAAQPQQLQQLLYNNEQRCTVARNIGNAIEHAVQLANDQSENSHQNRVLIFGSFFTVAAALQWLDDQ